MTRELYFGGSFNPPHFAHLNCAVSAAKVARLDGVVLVPTGQSALKAVQDLAPAVDRLAMTRLASEYAGLSMPVRVDDREVRRAGTSFTIDTVTALNDEGVSPVHWLIGADQLLNLHRWKSFEDLLRRAKFWIMARPGYRVEWDALHPAVAALRGNVVVVPQIEMSATDIRRRVRAGESLAGLVPEAVERYINEHGLYR
jgi:nicotinate-nucleotide adenylyltransferase